MIRLLYIFLVLAFAFGSCQNTKKLEETSEPIDSVQQPSGRILSQIGTPLSTAAKVAIEEWEEYQNVDDFIMRFYSISIMEAKTSAKELADLVVLMKDSIRVPILTEPNMIARFNVFKNEALRLSDMVTISAISDEEVKEEVLKVLEVYDAVNSKINTIYEAITLQENLEIDTETPVDLEEKSILRPKTFERNRSSGVIPPKENKGI